jgi:DNA-binding HxlR family transcriptional regulator
VPLPAARHSLQPVMSAIKSWAQERMDDVFTARARYDGESS